MKPGLVRLKRCAGVLALLVLANMTALANPGAGQGAALPWDGPLTTLVQSLTGPVAFAIAVIGIIACGAMLIFGGEMSDTMKRLLQVGIAACLIVFSSQVLNSFIGFAEDIPPERDAVGALSWAPYAGLTASVTPIVVTKPAS